MSSSRKAAGNSSGPCLTLCTFVKLVGHFAAPFRKIINTQFASATGAETNYTDSAPLPQVQKSGHSKSLSSPETSLSKTHLAPAGTVSCHFQKEQSPLNSLQGPSSVLQTPHNHNVKDHCQPQFTVPDHRLSS